MCAQTLWHTNWMEMKNAMNNYRHASVNFNAYNGYKQFTFQPISANCAQICAYMHYVCAFGWVVASAYACRTPSI